MDALADALREYAPPDALPLFTMARDGRPSASHAAPASSAPAASGAPASPPSPSPSGGSEDGEAEEEGGAESAEEETEEAAAERRAAALRASRALEAQLTSIDPYVRQRALATLRRQHLLHSFLDPAAAPRLRAPAAPAAGDGGGGGGMGTHRHDSYRQIFGESIGDREARAVRFGHPTSETPAADAREAFRHRLQRATTRVYDPPGVAEAVDDDGEPIKTQPPKLMRHLTSFDPVAFETAKLKANAGGKR